MVINSNFNDKIFEIIALGYTLNIPYEKLDYWMPYEYNANIIHLCLKKDEAIILHPGEKLELVNCNSHCIKTKSGKS